VIGQYDDLTQRIGKGKRSEKRMGVCHFDILCQIFWLFVANYLSVSELPFDVEVGIPAYMFDYQSVRYIFRPNYMSVCMYACTHVRTWVRVHVYVYVCVCTHMRDVCVYVYAHTRVRSSCRSYTKYKCW